MNPRRNDSAQVLLVLRDGAERGSRAKVQDQHIPGGEAGDRPNGVCNLVGAHLERVAIPDFQTRLHAWLKQKRVETEILEEATSKRVDYVWYYGANRSAIDP